MDIPKALRKYNLAKPGEQKQRYLVATGEGEPGTGKTDFFHRSFPGPKLVIDADLNGESVEDCHAWKDDTLIYHYSIPPEIDQDREYESFQTMKSLFEDSIEGGYFRSYMFDTWDAIYEWCRRGYHGTLEFGEIPEHKFRVVNTNMARFFRVAKANRVNLWLPCRMTDERRDTVNRKTGKTGSVRTGNRKAAGWKQTLYESQCHLRFDKDKDDRTLDKFSAAVVKCTGNTKAEGVTFIGEDIDLAVIGTFVNPKSKLEEWR